MCKEEDIIGTILFLSSDMSKYITGQNIIIDGGYSII
jgi:enoyl-[acyl-carrier-protein] reductase (NADH)